MKTTKIITIITSLLVLVTITGVGLFSGNTNVLIAPGLAVVVALFNAKHIFEDPEATTKLKEEHADEIRAMKHGHADFVAERVAAERETESKHRGEVAKLQAETTALKSKLVDTEKARQELHRKYTDIMPKARPIGQSFIASGSAKTQQPPQE